MILRTVLALLAVLLAGCGTSTSLGPTWTYAPPAAGGSAPSSASASESPATPSPPFAASLSPAATASPTTFTSVRFGYSLTLPAGWRYWLGLPDLKDEERPVLQAVLDSVAFPVSR